MERLLQYFTPEHYDLDLVIDRSRDLIEGTAKIHGSAHTDIIKFHAVNLEIISVALHPANTPLEFKATGDTVEISLPATGDIMIDIAYKTTLNKNMQGCYLSTYQYEGKTQKIATTQFESHYAREAFPCIDEPAAKASFSLTLKIPDLDKRDVVLANTPLISREGSTFTFEKTPRMSTYLLAWVVGPFHSVETTNRHGVKVASYAALNQPLDSLTFANDTAAKALDFYDEKFGVKYPLPKLDQVALPDFEAGAMENWGLVTYRESYMLVDPNSALSVKQSVATTVTHELSHQWFGNLVTMAWWDDLWLNESFATMIEYVATDALYPQYNIWQDFFTGYCFAALRRDSLPGVQSVQQEVHDPEEIATLFDSAIVYAKGARLMLMLYRLMGEEGFYRGLQDYFQKYKYQNTAGDDLWAALQPYADFDIKKFMHAWISQPGFPKISADGKEQHRFFINGETDDQVWPLPVVKDDMSGHYLINLDDAEFQNRLDRFDQLTLEQKLRLLIDRMLLAKTPAVPSSSLLDIIPKFTDETSAPIWNMLTSIISDIKLFCLPDSEPDQNYRAYLTSLFGHRFKDIDFGILTDDNDIQLRDYLLSIAAYVKDKNIIDKLSNMYQEDISQIDPELRGSVMVARLRQDEATYFPIFLNKYQSETDPDLKADLLFVIASNAKEPAHLDRLIDLLRQPDIVRPQDHAFLFIYLLRNHHVRERTLDWLYANWDYIKQLTGDKSIEDYPRCAAAFIRTPDEAAKFYAFFDPMMDDPILRRTLKMAHTDIDCRLQTIATDSAAVHEKLQTLAKKIMVDAR